ncbi:uncharacterized protein LOC127771313 [Oryza glaberrima]|uniref:uncharacterized protein LOC127771313 n=1 Tax=Oryza glaberrima TaxID=4538 RepID=UPI00224C2F1C|nr:uncharacterized protein LOC127771313 [Oryza glaberrima]
MEEIEGNLLESSIGWLTDIIVENLDNDKLGAWISQVGLADDTDKLRSEVDRVGMVVAAVKGRAIANKPLARSLGRLREVLYDADDAVDELDYYRLQQQVQGGTLASPFLCVSMVDVLYAPRRTHADTASLVHQQKLHGTIPQMV